MSIPMNRSLDLQERMHTIPSFFCSETSVSAPITTRSGFMKSCDSSSLLLKIPDSTPHQTVKQDLRLSNSACMVSPGLCRQSPRERLIYQQQLKNFAFFCPISLATDNTYFKSADPSASMGVPTAMKTRPVFFNPSSSWVLKLRLFFLTLFMTRLSSPGS